MKLIFLLLLATSLVASFSIKLMASESSADGYSPHKTFHINFNTTSHWHDTFWKTEHGGLEVLTKAHK